MMNRKIFAVLLLSILAAQIGSQNIKYTKPDFTPYTPKGIKMTVTTNKSLGYVKVRLENKSNDAIFYQRTLPDVYDVTNPKKPQKISLSVEEVDMSGPYTFASVAVLIKNDVHILHIPLNFPGSIYGLKTAKKIQVRIRPVQYELYEKEFINSLDRPNLKRFNLQKSMVSKPTVVK